MAQRAGFLLMFHVVRRAPFAVVAPITAVTAALTPIVTGVLASERPSVLSWTGATR